MIRSFIASACLVVALALVVGCGGQTGGGGGPKLANPDDPKVKDLAPAGVGGAGGGQAKPNPQ